MAYHLRNDKTPELALSINSQTWYALLELAEEHGWNPLGTVLPEWLVWTDETGGLEEMERYQGSYTPNHSRLVVLEDALNLGEAFGRAFLAYEPQWAYSYPGLSLMSAADPPRVRRPSIGAISAAADFCQRGAFWINWR